MPNDAIFSGATKGRTGVEGDSSALHLTVVCGHVCLGHEGHAGHTVGGGHFVSGHRGLGHGGQSPHSRLLHDDVSTITGSGVGTELLSTYCERSGTGGHSVFNIYWPISGHCLGGGIDVLRTYLERSGVGGHVSFPHELHTMGAVIAALWNPSRLLNRYARLNPSKNARTIGKYCMTDFILNTRIVSSLV